jgi:hypothetical protein
MHLEGVWWERIGLVWFHGVIGAFVMEASMELDDLHEERHRYGTATSRLFVQTFDSFPTCTTGFPLLFGFVSW